MSVPEAPGATDSFFATSSPVAGDTFFVTEASSAADTSDMSEANGRAKGFRRFKARSKDTLGLDAVDTPQAVDTPDGGDDPASTDTAPAVTPGTTDTFITADSADRHHPVPDHRHTRLHQDDRGR